MLVGVQPVSRLRPGLVDRLAVAAASAGIELIVCLHKVDLIDRADTVARECSFANGAQLSYSFVDAMASPELLRRSPALLTRSDPSIRLSPWFDPAAWRWCAEFAAQCTRSKHRANSAAALKLSLRSAALFEMHFADLPIEFDYREDGKFDELADRYMKAERDEFKELGVPFIFH